MELPEFPSHSELNDHKEPGCWVVVQDRKYFRVGNMCIKRTLRRHEMPYSELIQETTFPQRWKNDGAILQYLATHTNIPVPRFLGVFEDDGAFYHCTEFVEGVNMSSLKDEEKKVVEKEVLVHVATLKTLRSDRPGVPKMLHLSGEGIEPGEVDTTQISAEPNGSEELEPLLCCPPNATSLREFGAFSCFRVRDSVRGDFVMCHNDFSQHNIIVDPKTLKINAIIDWEYGGFFPEWFEKPYWKRKGPATALEGEENDSERVREWLRTYCDEVVMPRVQSLAEKLGFKHAQRDDPRNEKFWRKDDEMVKKNAEKNRSSAADIQSSGQDVQVELKKD